MFSIQTVCDLSLHKCCSFHLTLYYEINKSKDLLYYGKANNTYLKKPWEMVLSLVRKIKNVTAAKIL